MDVKTKQTCEHSSRSGISDNHLGTDRLAEFLGFLLLALVHEEICTRNRTGSTKAVAVLIEHGEESQLVVPGRTLLSFLLLAVGTNQQTRRQHSPTHKSYMRYARNAPQALGLAVTPDTGLDPSASHHWGGTARDDETGRLDGSALHHFTESYWSGVVSRRFGELGVLISPPEGRKGCRTCELRGRCC